jgi:hypothetical protein
MSDDLDKAVCAVQKKLECIATEGYEYVGDTDNPESICLDGWFNIRELIKIALDAIK